MLLYWFVKKDVMLTTVQFMGVCMAGGEASLLAKATYYIEMAEKFTGTPVFQTSQEEIEKKFKDVPELSFKNINQNTKVYFALTFKSTAVREDFLKSVELLS